MERGLPWSWSSIVIVYVRVRDETIDGTRRDGGHV